MSRIVYVNGEYLPEEEARISIFDRGFLFADGVYEVSSVLRGRLIENEGHIKRLHRSLNELNMAAPASDAEIETIQKTLIEKNGVEEGGVYLQVTRGAADRDFLYPKDAKPSLILFTQARPLIESQKAKTGMSVILLEDIRWKRRDIKTVGLLAQSMAKQAAYDAGADDAWMHQDGMITEGSSNNAYIIKDGTLITRHLSNDILHGITRRSVLALAKETDMPIEERAFTPEEAKTADEAFVTSASTFVMPVVKIDDVTIGNGTPGPIATRLRALYIEEALNSIKD